jgi:hypothetical protein
VIEIARMSLSIRAIFVKHKVGGDFMTIRFLIEWRSFKVGQITDTIPSGVADMLVRRGIAEVSDKSVKPKKKKAE